MVSTSQKRDSRGSNIGGFSRGSRLKLMIWLNAFESSKQGLILTWETFVEVSVDVASHRI
jgi:hypothetical protein